MCKLDYNDKKYSVTGHTETYVYQTYYPTIGHEFGNHKIIYSSRNKWDTICITAVTVARCNELLLMVQIISNIHVQIKYLFIISFWCLRSI